MDLHEHIEGLYSVKCDLDLETLRASSEKMYHIVKESFTGDSSDYSGQSTLTTKLFAKYNFCMYPFPGINILYWNIHHVFHSCLTQFYGGRVDTRFFMQSWLNYYKKGEFINWHSHTKQSVGAWHGFFCLDVEPDSYTSYKWPKDPERNDVIVDVHSQNNLMVMGLSNDDQHKSSEWLHDDRPRITIAFDILPEEHVLELTGGNDWQSYKKAMDANSFFMNHWIPM